MTFPPFLGLGPVGALLGLLWDDWREGPMRQSCREEALTLLPSTPLVGPRARPLLWQGIIAAPSQN